MNAEYFTKKVQVHKEALDANPEYGKYVIRQMNREVLQEISDKFGKDDLLDIIVGIKPVGTKFINQTNTVIYDLCGYTEEIVRCKNCKHGMKLDEFNVFCNAMVRNVVSKVSLFDSADCYVKKPWNYCSGGVKKTEECDVGDTE